MEEITFQKIEADIKDLRDTQKEAEQHRKETEQLIKEITLLHKETDQQLKETDQQLKETDQQIKEVVLLHKETDQQLKETKQLLKEVVLLHKETEQQLKETTLLHKETEQQLKETTLLHKETEQQIKKASVEHEETKRFIKRHNERADKRMNKLESLFTGQWGKLIESLVSGDLIRLLQQRDVKVEEIYERVSGKWQDKQYEFDIVASNGLDIVVTEVKTTMHVSDVNHFLGKLENYRTIRSDSRGRQVYGAMAYLRSEQNSSTYAQRKGLFVIKATGNSASIINKTSFTPRNF